MEAKRPEGEGGTANEREAVLSELRRAVPGSERLFDVVVGALSDPITIRDRDQRIVYANRAALDHLGFDSWEELRQVDADRIMADYTVTGEDGRPISMDDIPSVRILRGEPAEPLLIRTVHRRTGVLHWNLLKASPLLDVAGEVEATIMIIEDITEQKLAQLRATFLAKAGDVLASSLDYEQTLAQRRRAGGPRHRRLVRRRSVPRRRRAPAGGGGARRPGAVATGRGASGLRPAETGSRAGPRTGGKHR